MFDYIERVYNPTRRHSTLGSEPDGLRKADGCSLTGCPRNQVLLTLGLSFLSGKNLHESFGIDWLWRLCRRVGGCC